MIRVFISVPMKDRTKEEIENTLAKIKEKVRKFYWKEEVEFVNTFVEEKPPYESGEHTAVWYLGKSLEILSTCDVVVTCGDIDYEKYNGCFIEKEVAERYGLRVLLLNGVFN